MTLSRQLLLSILLVSVLAFAGIFLISVASTRQYLGQQLEWRARDAATALATSLLPHMRAADVPQLRSTVNAVFAGGAYREIRVSTADGRSVMERKRELGVSDVPQWFVEAVTLPGAGAEALIESRWGEGRVWIATDPAQAYRVLWRSALGTLWWSLVCLVCGLALGALLLRHLLYPLAKMEAQARAIGERRFSVLERMPRARELRRVMMAMNTMSERIRRMLDEQTALAARLREEAYTDPLTGVGNRRCFEQRLAHMLGAPDEHTVGALLLVRLEGLDEINRVHGRAAGDELLCAAGRVLGHRFADANAFVGRIGGTEFGVLLSAADPELIQQQAAQVSQELAALARADTPQAGAHIGVSCVNGGRCAAELLAEADTALRRAEQRGRNQWHVFESQDPERFVARGVEQWRALLQQVIEQRDVVLMYQAVESPDLRSVIHYEVLTRIRGDGGRLIPAGIFLPMAERVGLASALDRLIIETVMEDLTNARDDAPYALNVSPASLGKPRFARWLCKRLSRAGGIAERLAFEVPEYAAHVYLDQTRELSSRLGRLGARFGIDHFGVGAPSFAYLCRLSADYVKIDGSYVNGLVGDRGSQFFLRVLTDIARLLEMEVIAEFVETKEQLDILRDLGVNGVQGYFVVKPDVRREQGRMNAA
jgi:diguanylate cyclase (GGDEF)-like protein